MPREAAPAPIRWTGAGAMAETLTLDRRFKIVEVRLHLSAAGAGEFIITLDARAGAEHDANILTQDMAALADLDLPIEGDPWFFDTNDEVDFAWPNGDARTWGLEVWWVDLG